MCPLERTSKHLWILKAESWRKQHVSVKLYKRNIVNKSWGNFLGSSLWSCRSSELHVCPPSGEVSAVLSHSTFLTSSHDEHWSLIHMIRSSNSSYWRRKNLILILQWAGLHDQRLKLMNQSSVFFQLNDISIRTNTASLAAAVRFNWCACHCPVELDQEWKTNTPTSRGLSQSKELDFSSNPPKQGNSSFERTLCMSSSPLPFFFFLWFNFACRTSL